VPNFGTKKTARRSQQLQGRRIRSLAVMVRNRRSQTHLFLVFGLPCAIGPLSVPSVCLSVLSVCNVRALWPNGWTNQDETWHAGRPRPWPHVLVGDPAPPPPKGHSPPIFGSYLLRPNGCMDQDVTWYGARPRPRRLCVRWGPRSPSPKGGRSPTNFRPMFIVAKRLDG